MCVDIYAHECAGQRLMSKIILNCSSTFLTEAGSLSQAQSLQIQLVLLAGLLWGSISSLSSKDRLAGGLSHPPGIYVGSGIQIQVLKFGPVFDKHFYH